MGIAIEPVRDYIIKKLHLNVNALYYKVPQTLKAWVIIFTGELFFRANGLRAGFHMFASIFKNFNIQNIWNGTLLKFGLDRADFAAIIFGLLLCSICTFARHMTENFLICFFSRHFDQSALQEIHQLI